MTSPSRAVEVSRQADNGRWVPVGTYVLPPRPSRPGVFIYHEDYDGLPLAPSLDYLKAGKREFVHFGTVNPNRRGPDADDLHPVFAQALPGRWGELVLASHSAAYARSSPAEKLFQLGDWQSGGLRFNATDMDVDNYVETYAALVALQKKVDSFIQRYATDKVCPFPLGHESYRWALSTHGGSQPKAAYLDDMGEAFVAKFPREIIGTYQEARVEASLLEVSRRAGLKTADSTLMSNSDGSSILLSRRFDVAETGVLLHTISGSAAIASPQYDYMDLVSFVHQHGSDPEGDVEEIFGRMIMNRAVNNTDDHLDQWVFIQDDKGQWTLAPNIDVMVNDADMQGRAMPHALAMLGDHEPALSTAWVLRAGAAFGIDEQRSAAIAQRVLSAVLEFPAIARDNGVDPARLLDSIEPSMALAAAERTVRALREAEAQRAAAPGL